MSGSVLKLLACLSMLLDHIAAYAPNCIPGIGDVLFSIGSKEITIYYLMRSAGRLAFPIFAFLIAEGFIHTRNRTKYAINLLAFAIISEIPFNLAYSGNFFSPKQNVFFTLLFGYLGICCVERFNTTKNFRELLILSGLFVLSIIFRADYGCFGYGFTILMYILRKNRVLMAIIGSCVLPSRWIGGTAFIPICLYNGKRGFATGIIAKYGFYLFYPVHHLILYFCQI